MDVVKSCPEIVKKVAELHRAGETIGVVPTMGALHEGHLALVDLAKRKATKVVVTIFVNPTQFAPNEDLKKYPRTLEADLAKLQARQVDLVFTPNETEIYPPGFSTFVEPPEVSRILEGRFRPNHFRGVSTVVLKILNLIQADIAVFGQKDFQQALVIKAMVRDLNCPTQIIIAPIQRDPDGLAMSSRNRYLTPDQRRTALNIYRCLLESKKQILGGAKQGQVVSLAMRDYLIKSGIDDIDYAVVSHAATLDPVVEINLPVVLLIAVRVGSTRLIDNELIEKAT